MAALAKGVLVGLALTLGGCGFGRTKAQPFGPNVQPFNFKIAAGADDFNIEGYLALSREQGRLPALLIVSARDGNARRCIATNGAFTAMGMQVACISMPGSGGSSGPGRFVGPQAVEAGRRALDLLTKRPDVDPKRLGVWGLGEGAVAAGLLMDTDTRLRAIALQSGVYDPVGLWPEAPLGTKLQILRQVWPSRRNLTERSVIAHLPPHLSCKVLILHGKSDRQSPLSQAERLAQALNERGARVKTRYFAHAGHELGTRVVQPLRDFLQESLFTPYPSVAQQG